MKRFWNLATLATRPRPKVGSTPADVVHRENKWRLLRYRRDAAAVRFASPVLLVPSLINRHYVLDLLPGKSLVEYLVGQGHDVFLLEWGTPGPEDRYLTFDDICDRYLGRALRKVARCSDGQPPHVLGYCQGGTMAAIHAAAHPDRFASLTLLASPISFVDDGLLTSWMKVPGFDVRGMVNAFGNVPWPLMQSTFQMLRPTMNLYKAVQLLDRAWNDEFLEVFMAMEAWVNDNVSLPGEFYARYAEDLFRKNLLAKGELQLSGRTISLASVTCPTLTVTFENDSVVPWRSAAVAMDLVGSADKERMHLVGGHVGAVVSKHAAKTLWPALSAFWAARDLAPTRPPATDTDTQPLSEAAQALAGAAKVGTVPTEKPTEPGVPMEPPAPSSPAPGRTPAGIRRRPRLDA